MELKHIINASCQAIFPADFRIVDTTNITQFYQSGNVGTIIGNFNSSRLAMNTKDSSGISSNSLLIEYGNHAVLQGQAGQGIDILNNQISMNGVTTFNNSVNVNNNTITLTDGTTTNTLNKSDWTGTIKTVNTTANLTHYLNFSDSSATGQGNPQKSTLITCNPSNGNITATSFNGTFFGTAANASNITLTSDNTNGTYYIPFSKTTASSSNALYLDDITGPLTYNPSTGTITATTFSGALSGNATTATTASNITLTSDNTSGTYYIPFSKTIGLSSNQLFLDDAIGALTYNPSLGVLTATNFTGDVAFSNGATGIGSFTSGILTLVGSNLSFRNFNFVVTGTTNLLTGLVFTSFRINGLYNVGILNNGTGDFTINNTGLGANIRTTYSTLIIPTGRYGMMTINVLLINSVTQYIINVQLLTN